MKPTTREIYVIQTWRDHPRFGAGWYDDPFGAYGSEDEAKRRQRELESHGRRVQIVTLQWKTRQN